MPAVQVDLARTYQLETFGEIDSDTSAIWSQLYLAGYVTTRDVDEPDNSSLARRLEVPNLEVRRLFRDELMERAYAAAARL